MNQYWCRLIELNTCNGISDREFITNENARKSNTRKQHRHQSCHWRLKNVVFFVFFYHWKSLVYYVDISNHLALWALDYYKCQHSFNVHKDVVDRDDVAERHKLSRTIRNWAFLSNQSIYFNLAIWSHFDIDSHLLFVNLFYQFSVCFSHKCFRSSYRRLCGPRVFFFFHIDPWVMILSIHFGREYQNTHAHK